MWKKHGCAWWLNRFVWMSSSSNPSRGGEERAPSTSTTLWSPCLWLPRPAWRSCSTKRSSHPGDHPDHHASTRPRWSVTGRRNVRTTVTMVVDMTLTLANWAWLYEWVIVRCRHFSEGSRFFFTSDFQLAWSRCFLPAHGRGGRRQRGNVFSLPLFQLVSLSLLRAVG